MSVMNVGKIVFGTQMISPPTLLGMPITMCVKDGNFYQKNHGYNKYHCPNCTRPELLTHFNNCPMWGIKLNWDIKKG